jgi:hypothetical protein
MLKRTGSRSESNSIASGHLLMSVGGPLTGVGAPLTGVDEPLTGVGGSLTGAGEPLTRISGRAAMDLSEGGFQPSVEWIGLNHALPVIREDYWSSFFPRLSR